jgi:hypothetical protein
MIPVQCRYWTTNREGGQHAVISAIRETDLLERLVHGSAKLSAVAV